MLGGEVLEEELSLLELLGEGLIPEELGLDGVRKDDYIRENLIHYRIKKILFLIL